MNPVVVLAKCASYEAIELDRGLAEATARVDDWAGLFRGSRTVLLKPNFLAACAPESAVTTHPQFICAVIRAVRQVYRGRLLLGDSPTAGPGSRIARKLSLPKLIEEHEVEMVDFEDTARIAGGGGFGPFNLARQVVESDLVINLPKVKTHAQMSLSLGIKNLYGAFVGLDKARWHLHAGRDYARFAGLLLELERRIKPAMTIADGVVGMEGNGPMSGAPRRLGLIAASTDTLALDRVLAEILGFPIDQVPVLAEAAARRQAAAELANIELRGEPLDRFRVTDWKPARPARCDSTVIPRFLAQPLRDQLTNHPVFDHRRCTRCGSCLKHCALEALRLAPRGRQDAGPKMSDQKVVADLDRCIRCYCCQEVCPQGAISVGEGALLKLSHLLEIALRADPLNSIHRSGGDIRDKSADIG